MRTRIIVEHDWSPRCRHLLARVPKVMKRDLRVFALIFFLLIHITGCSVTRFVETRVGYGVKKANRTDLDLDFQLDFNPTARSFIVTLEYQPYAISKPRITLIDLGVGLAALGLLGKVFYDNWDHDHTFTFVDDTFDWYDSDPWEKAVLIGVPIDILLYWGFSYPFDRKAIKVRKEPLIAHPYRFELPDHGRIGRDYKTVTGTEQIEIQKFLSELRHPSYLQDLESLKFRVSTEVSGRQYNRDHTLSGEFIPLPPPPHVESSSVKVDAQWIEHRLRAGEKAILKVIVENTGETMLTAVTTTTLSSDPYFDNWVLEFGNIAQDASETRILRCGTSRNLRPQGNVSVTLRFEAATGVIHPEIETEFEIIE